MYLKLAWTSPIVAILTAVYLRICLVYFIHHKINTRSMYRKLPSLLNLKINDFNSASTQTPIMDSNNWINIIKLSNKILLTWEFHIHIFFVLFSNHFMHFKPIFTFHILINAFTHQTKHSYMCKVFVEIRSSYLYKICGLLVIKV